MKLNIFSNLLFIPVLVCYPALSVAIDFGSGEPAQPEIKNYGYNYLEENSVSQNVSSHTTDLLGDKIDPNTGTVAIEQVDIDIPGNFKIPVRIKRKLSGPDSWYRETREFENWSLDIPHVRSTYLTDDEGNFYSSYWPSGNACSAPLNSNPTLRKNFGGTTYYAHSISYWNGDTVYIPEKGSVKLTEKENDDTSTRYNNRNWKVDCISTDNGYEGFKVTTGDGTEYYFKQQKILEGIKPFNLSPAANTQVCDGVYIPCAPLTIGYPEDSPVQYPQYFIFMLATEVKDRFGNWVKYNYESNGSLSSIISSDGREINISYTNNRISSISADGETWLYTYNNASGGIIATLEKVTRPDNLFWLFEYDEDSYNSLWRYMNIAHHSQLNTGGIDQCVANGFEVEFLSITHPEGATGSFKLHERCLNKSNVPKIVRPNPNRWPGERYWIPLGSNLWTLKSKNLSLPSGEDYLWEYNYTSRVGQYRGDEFSSTNRFSFDLDGVETGNMNYTEIVNPDNSKLRYYYSRKVGNGLNNLLFKEVYDVDGTLLQRDEMHYEDGIYHGTSKQYTHISAALNSWTLDDVKLDHSSSQQQNLTETKTTLFSANLASTYTTQYDDFNIYDAAKLTTEFNSFSARRKEVRKSYDHDLTQWVLNQPTTIEVKNDDGIWEVLHEQTYYNKTHSSYPFYPYSKKSFGNWVIRNTAYTDEGKISRINFNTKLTDNKNYRFQEFADYHRGQPQVISTSNRYDAIGSVTINRVVDNKGRVTRITDYNGVSTNYTYGVLGRLKSVDLTNDAVNGNWYDTLYTWDNDTNTRTVSTCTLDSSRTACTGNAVFKTTEYYDNLLRLTKTKSQDLANSSAANSTRYQRFEYNYLNQRTFQSYASANISENKGTTTVYDSLGRQQSITTSGLGTVNYAYLSGNRIELTNAKGHVTTTTYQAFGSPNYSRAIKIESPENVTTTLDIDIFGLTHAITQSGANQYGNSTSVTERRYYDNSKQLCLTTRPDVGNTFYKYNALGELIWSQSGVANTQCTSTAPSGSNFYTYDNLGSLKHVNYPDASGDVSYERDNNGNVKTLTAGNVIHRYEYNNQNLLEEEQLFVGNELPLILNYEYNALQQHEQLGYPDGTIVNFKPNGFGEPTEAQVYKSGSVDLSFAKSASYYANGTLSSFTYGNGVKHQTTLYADSLLPKQLKDTGPAGSNIPSTVMALTYDYDNNANVTSIIDSQNSAYSLTNLQYDDLDRLTSTTGAAGIGSSEMHYDGLGNITYYKNKGKTLNYTYDYAKNRLSKVTGVSGRYGSIGYDTRGNITNNGAYSLSFNRANQLTSAKGNSYLYDGHNRRVKQTDANGISYSMYSQDGTLLYREKGDTITGSGTNYIYLGKKLIAKYGDVTPQTVNESRQHARPFGESIEAPKDDVGYTGHKFDTDLGLSYMQARYYDPVIGRFYSNDPVNTIGHFSQGNIHGFNRYAYANNNPYKYTDPDGKFAIPLLFTPPALAAMGKAAAFVGSAAAAAWAGSEAINAYNESADPVEGILDGATEGEKTKGRTKNFDKQGGMDQANSDFDDVVDPDSVETITDGKGGEGRRGTVNDGSGRKVNVRPNSTDGRPTVEVQDGKNKTKIRYDEEKS